MRWSRSEVERLYPVLEQVSFDLRPVDGKRILVLCSAQGDVAFWLGEMMETGKVTALELDPESLQLARRSAREMGLEGMVEFLPAAKDYLDLPDASFEALVSDFIVYPTASPTEMGQPEMSRVLAPGGRLVSTDVILTRPLPQPVRQELSAIGLDYLHGSTREDFRTWMADAGLENIEIMDLTSTVRSVWESRRKADHNPAHLRGYAYLLDNPESSLGKAIFYIYARADKPRTPQGV